MPRHMHYCLRVGIGGALQVSLERTVTDTRYRYTLQVSLERTVTPAPDMYSSLGSIVFLCLPNAIAAKMAVVALRELSLSGPSASPTGAL